MVGLGLVTVAQVMCSVGASSHKSHSPQCNNWVFFCQRTGKTKDELCWGFCWACTHGACPCAVSEKGSEAESWHHHPHHVCHHCQQERVPHAALGPQTGQNHRAQGERRPPHQTTKERPGGWRGPSARREEGQTLWAPQVLWQHPQGDALQEARSLCMALLQARGCRGLGITWLSRYYQTPHGSQYCESTSSFTTSFCRGSLWFRGLAPLWEGEGERVETEPVWIPAGYFYILFPSLLPFFLP